MGTNYTVSVSNIAGYLDCADQAYTAGYQSEKNIIFQYRALGVFIEAIDGTLYTASQWDSAGKTANSIVIVASNHRFRIWPQKYTGSGLVITDSHTETISGCNNITTASTAYNYFNGESDTEILAAAHPDPTVYELAYCKNYTFPDGITKGYMPSSGELYILQSNKTAYLECATKLGSTDFDNMIMSSTNAYSNNTALVWCTDKPGSDLSSRHSAWGGNVIVVGKYE